MWEKEPQYMKHTPKGPFSVSHIPLGKNVAHQGLTQSNPTLTIAGMSQCPLWCPVIKFYPAHQQSPLPAGDPLANKVPNSQHACSAFELSVTSFLDSCSYSFCVILCPIGFACVCVCMCTCIYIHVCTYVGAHEVRWACRCVCVRDHMCLIVCVWVYVFKSGCV